MTTLPPGAGEPKPFDPVRVRRLVTGIDPSGRSVALSDAEAPSPVGADGRSGMQVVEMWQTTATPPDLSGEDLTTQPLEIQPVAGGLHWRVVVFPERTEPGFVHRTDTLDLLYIVSGQVSLGVGDDPASMHEVEVGRGDAVVALGNVHRWSNRGPGPCVAVATMVSASGVHA